MCESDDSRAPLDLGAAGQLRALSVDAISLLGGSPAVASEVEALEFAQESLGAADLHVRRIGETVAFNHLARVSPLLDADRRDSWRSTLDRHVPPIAREIEEAIVDQDLLQDWASDQLRRQLPKLAIGGLIDPSESDAWAASESLSRVARARADLIGVEKSEPAIHYFQPLAVRGADTAVRTLRSRVEAGLRPAANPVPDLSTSRDLATLNEAVADALTNPRSRELTLALNADGFLDEHISVVTEVVGKPTAVPVIVLAEPRWISELSLDRGDLSGTGHRGTAIVLSRTAGEEARANKDSGRLNHVLIHAARRSDRVRGPGGVLDDAFLRLESAIDEGVTEHLARQVLDRARTSWAEDDGPNPYDLAELPISPYTGFTTLCQAAVEAGAQAESADGWDALCGRGPAVDRLTELLTGGCDLDHRRDLIDLCQPLIDEAAGADQLPLGEVAPEILERARTAFSAYAQAHR